MNTEVLAELRALRAEVAALRRELAPRSPSALVAAIGDFFGEGRFTVAGLLEIAGDDPHGAIGVALAALVDLNAGPRARATALGLLLSRMPEVEGVASVRGVAVYRLRTWSARSAD